MRVWRVSAMAVLGSVPVVLAGPLAIYQHYQVKEMAG